MSARLLALMSYIGGPLLAQLPMETEAAQTVVSRRRFDMSVRVLLVDDSVVVRDEIRRHLECMGCVVVAEAADTLQGLALFQTVSPALVMVDVAVPQTSGIGALALLRIMRREDPKVHVLMLGSIPRPEVRKSFVDEGAVDFLMTPSLRNGFECMRKRLEELFPELNMSAQMADHRLIVKQSAPPPDDMW